MPLRRIRRVFCTLLACICLFAAMAFGRLSPRSNPYNTIGPGLVYQPSLRGEMAFTEGYDYKTGFGHAGSMTTECREKLNSYVKNCQGMDRTTLKSKCEDRLAKWQVSCLYGNYLQ